MKSIVVRLTNRFVTFTGDYPQADLLPYYSFHPSGYRFVPAFRMGRWDGRIRLLKRDMVPTGLFLATKDQIEKELGLRFTVKWAISPLGFRSTGITSDRAYQNECVERMMEAACSGGGLILCATRTGKTRMAGQFFSRLKGNACFIVDELTLLHQNRKELEEVMGEEVGYVGKGEFEPRRVTVATVQTLHWHRDDPKFEAWTETLQVNVIDEIHLNMNRRNFDVVEAIAPPAVFGLTATLELQKKDVRTKAYALTGPVCYEYPLEQGQQEGHLARGVVMLVQTPGPGDSAYRSYQYSQMYDDLIVKNDSRNEFICALVREAIEHGKFPAVLVERIAHLNKLSQMLSDIPHQVVCGDKAAEERVAAIRNFQKGSVKLLLVNKVFQKGVTIPKLDVTIDGGAMKGPNRAIQIFGRGIGQATGKTGLLHFDISDTDNRFEKASKQRRTAFKKRGIPVKKVESELGAARIFEQAEKFLLDTIDDHRPKQQLLKFMDAPVCD